MVISYPRIATSVIAVSEAGLKVFMQQVLNHLDQLSQSVISCTNEVNRTSRLLELEVKNHSRFLELELKNVSHKIEQEIRSLRNRQDIIVNKQDQIQSTLHGDTPAFQSPPLTYMHSPAFTSPTSSVVGNRMSAGPQTTQSAQSELSSLLDESDLESFLSFDWGEPTIQTTPHCDNVQRAGTSRHCTTTALPQYGQGATSILFTPEQYGQQATSATSILSPNEQYVTAAGATGAKEKADRADGTAAAKVAGIGMLSGKHGTGFPSHTWVKPEVPMCGQKFTTGTPVLKHGTPAAMPQCSPASAGTSQETETSTTTVTPHRTTEALLKDPERVLASYDSINEKDVGKITRILASQAIFGIGVLRQSTVRGDKKRGLAPLDPTKISTLLSIIHHHRSFIQLSKAEFDEVTKKKILPSLSHYCKELRNRT